MMKHVMALFIFFVAVNAQAQVKTYLNYSAKSQYVDYRNITRSGDNLEQVILEEIGKANQSIFLAVQELRLPLVARALIEKKKQNVDVRVVLEHDYNFSVLDQRDSSDTNEHEASKML